MRNLFLMLLMGSATTGSVQGMSVVVHTSDRVVVDYVCTERRALGQRDAVRRVVQAPGRFNWHVVNGKAPYRVIDQYTDGAGNVCITVMDALGNMAIGCGIITERRYSANVTCTPYQDEGPVTRFAIPPKSAPKVARTGHREPVVRERSPLSTKRPDRVSDPDNRPPAPTRTVDRKIQDGHGGHISPGGRTTRR